MKEGHEGAVERQSKFETTPETAPDVSVPIRSFDDWAAEVNAKAKAALKAQGMIAPLNGFTPAGYLATDQEKACLRGEHEAISGEPLYFLGLVALHVCVHCRAMFVPR